MENNNFLYGCNIIYVKFKFKNIYFLLYALITVRVTVDAKE